MHFERFNMCPPFLFTPPKVVLAALKLFLAFADANDCRADGMKE